MKYTLLLLLSWNQGWVVSCQFSQQLASSFSKLTLLIYNFEFNFFQILILWNLFCFSFWVEFRDKLSCASFPNSLAPLLPNYQFFTFFLHFLTYFAFELKSGIGFLLPICQTVWSSFARMFSKLHFRFSTFTFQCNIKRIKK